jgi:predicted ATPase with chaperone activity
MATGGCVPNRRITVNLTPADVKKEGPACNLPMAPLVLVIWGQLVVEELGRASDVRHMSWRCRLG